jgi:DNA invertase Pin-like site-specific DNA recombinase
VRVLIYIRQSDTDGSGRHSLSLDSMESELRLRCSREGWSVVGLVADPDLRGWQDERARPGLSEALARAARGGYDILLLWDLSRLARKVEYQERWIRILAIDGVEVESHTEPEARRTPLIRQIKGAINEDRTREIAANTRRALRERALRGLGASRVPWGYSRPAQDRAIEPDRTSPKRIEAIQRMFSMSANGCGTSAIAGALEADGLLSPTGLLE